MNLRILLTGLLCCLCLKVSAQPAAVPDAADETLYRWLRQQYAQASGESDVPIVAFLKAAYRISRLDNDTTRRAFSRLQQEHRNMDDSAVIGLMLSPVINRFLDEDFQSSVCPAAYERAEDVLHDYSSYMCSCIPESLAHIKQYDSAAVLYDALQACKRRIRSNDSLQQRLPERLAAYGIHTSVMNHCADAYAFTHCGYLRDIITDLCTNLALVGYRLLKSYVLSQVAVVLEHCLHEGKLDEEVRKLFDDTAAEQMDAAAYWAKPELISTYWQPVFCYSEVRNYGHELVMTFLIDDVHPLFVAQVSCAVKWEGGQFRITSVHVTKSKFIQDKEQILTAARAMRQKLKQLAQPR